MKKTFHRYKRLILFVLAMSIMGGLGQYLLNYETGNYRFQLIFLDWKVYEQLELTRFFFPVILIIIISYCIIMINLIEQLMMLNNHYFMVRCQSILKYFMIMSKHFLAVSFMYNICCICFYCLFFHFWDYTLIAFCIKNSFALTLIIFVYYLLTFYYKDNPILCYLIMAIMFMVDITIGSSFLAFNTSLFNTMIYVLIYIIGFAFVFMMLLRLYKKKEK